MEEHAPDEDAISRFITGAFEAVDVTVLSGTRFFFHAPGLDPEAEHRMPFATLVSDDEHDRASQLSRPGVFRLNIGVGPERYRSLFGTPPVFFRDDTPVETGHDFTQFDFTVLDRVLPHPVYAPLGWVCVLNPSPATFRQLHPLLAEAYRLAAQQHIRRR